MQSAEVPPAELLRSLCASSQDAARVPSTAGGVRHYREESTSRWSVSLLPVNATTCPAVSASDGEAPSEAVSLRRPKRPTRGRQTTGKRDSSTRRGGIRGYCKFSPTWYAGHCLENLQVSDQFYSHLGGEAHRRLVEFAFGANKSLTLVVAFRNHSEFINYEAQDYVEVRSPASASI